MTQLLNEVRKSQRTSVKLSALEAIRQLTRLIRLMEENGSSKSIQRAIRRTASELDTIDKTTVHLLRPENPNVEPQLNLWIESDY